MNSLVSKAHLGSRWSCASSVLPQMLHKTYVNNCESVCRLMAGTNTVQLAKYLNEHTKSVLLIRGTYSQYCLIHVL